MSDALHWLIGEKENGEQNNSSPKHFKIDNKNLAALPDRGVTRVECQDHACANGKQNKDVDIETGPVNLDDDERVFNSGEMGGFIPTNIDMKKEERWVPCFCFPTFFGHMTSVAQKCSVF